ncbi:hypothetical protein GCM10011504_44870 [Siccirubricoccus deserti]|uniref:Uncharacterized protein n=1 Tax=Siccirubricoccus deserti TaxID=2013562 RepID=A0A9X0R1N0_9PROT|nr:hypothetical protein [Siccirubricoccus deserti]MBC4017900.1 hypothetical protein [Siccirubricoccus deserti]GGC61671.1 hypothetical protein GCM10011504_44870 [Siccirubricoccus deserti]
MRGLPLLVLLLLALSGPARAQPEATPAAGRESDMDTLCSLPGWLSGGGTAGNPGRTARAIAQWIDFQRLGSLRIDRDVKQISGAEAIVLVSVLKPEAMPDAVWNGGYFMAIAYRGEPGTLPPPDGRGVLVARVDPPIPEKGITPTRIAFRPPETGWRSTWQLAVAVCLRPAVAEGAAPPPFANRPAMFGLTTVTVSSYYLSVAAGLGSVGVLYLMLALAARQLHELQLRETASRAPDRRPLQAWLRAFSPIVISQDAFGTASLSRFQVLLFTLAAVGVYAYVLIRTGELSSLSSDVLWLLGITMAGSALASIAGGPVVSTGNRLWLLATGVLDNAPRRPRWHDLLGADGEIDVTRVQALAFSAFAAAALVANGPNDLERFEVPDTLKYLIGLSQAVYVAGKALPRETAKQLNDELRLLRDAERDTLQHPEDTTARTAFVRARTALQTSLGDIFGDRFHPEKLRNLQPGAGLDTPPSSNPV